MKRYVQFYESKPLGNLGEVLGSDGYIPIDGRLSVSNACFEARGIMLKRNASPLNKGIVAFELRKGDFKQYRVEAFWRITNFMSTVRKEEPNE